MNVEKLTPKNSQLPEQILEELRNLVEQAESNKERYHLNWAGKAKSMAQIAIPAESALHPNVEESVNFDTTENLFISGDNLEALKILRDSYLNKVKMIYIDPPYNTGNDFVYKDNFKQSQADYDQQTGDIDEDGDRLVANNKSNGRFHSDWLSMMMPRLRLARDLLSDDGVIFISIDDNEQANLKLLCDEIFGEENFVANIAVVNNLKGRSDDAHFATSNEHMLCYSKNIKALHISGFEMSEEARKEYKLKDKISNYKKVSLQKTGKNSRRIDRPNMYYEIFYNPKTKKFSLENFEGALAILPTPINGIDGRWRWGRETFLKNKDTELIAGQVNGIWRVYVKMRDSIDGEARTIKPKTTWINPKYDTGNGGKSTFDLFGIKNLFENPKSPFFISDIVKISTLNDSTVLDFFAGSATTADAVMQLNAEDGGNRKFIMVQIPEQTDEKSEAFKAGYKTIDAISKERIRRAAAKIKSENPEAAANLDLGFRALELVKSNKVEGIERTADQIEQGDLESAISNLRPELTDLDLLYDVIQSQSLLFNAPIEQAQLAGEGVLKYDYFGEDSGVVCYFGGNFSRDFIEALANLKPLEVVFRETEFQKSSQKVTAMEQFRALSPNTKVRVL